MRNLLTLALAAALLAWWLRQRNERRVFVDGTLAELDGYIKSAHMALINDDYMQVSEMMLDMHRIIEAERRRR